MSSVKHYALVTAGLLALLLLTVGAAYLHFGAFNTAIAMAISVAKASLILMFFMHLRQASPLIRLAACAGVFWLALLLALTLSDYLMRSLPCALFFEARRARRTHGGSTWFRRSCFPKSQ